MGNTHRKALESALEWYVDHGIDEILGDEPVDRTKRPAPKEALLAPVMGAVPRQNAGAAVSNPAAPSPASLGRSAARQEALKLAAGANTLDDLRAAIEEFDGISIKKTATNLVFADGNPKADIMIIGEAPEADEDRLGIPFSGASGALLDKILACIDLSRTQDDQAKAVYVSNILNWRPPGGRTPSDAEIDVSLPFIEKHIMLVQPKILILCGGVPAKALLDANGGISRMRKSWHDYKPRAAELGYEGPPIPAIVTYHPTYLLSTPAQKKAVWADILSVQEKRNETNLK